jgi:hypothetical protein
LSYKKSPCKNLKKISQIVDKIWLYFQKLSHKVENSQKLLTLKIPSKSTERKSIFFYNYVVYFLKVIFLINIYLKTKNEYKYMLIIESNNNCINRYIITKIAWICRMIEISHYNLVKHIYMLIGPLLFYKRKLGRWMSFLVLQFTQLQCQRLRCLKASWIEGLTLQDLRFFWKHVWI